MRKQKLSVAVIAKNEADRIGSMLKSCSFADEIIVVDSGSIDGTQELCKKAGALVLFNQWPGYVAQKQFALEATSSEWILCLDADEEVSAELANEILSAIENSGSDDSAFSMPRLSRYLDRWIKHGGWYPDRKIRLVRRDKGKWQGEDPHDKLVAEGKIKTLKHPILHHVYRGISDQIVTINSFSDIYAMQGKSRNGLFVVWGVFRAIGKFFECYLWKCGFLDGIPGIIIAANSAWYVFLKHAKKWERNLRSK